MDARYELRLSPPGRRLAVSILETDGGEPRLDAHLAGERRPLGDRELLRTLLRFPLQTLRVTGAGHVEALRLWRKGTPFHSHPDRGRIGS